MHRQTIINLALRNNGFITSRDASVNGIPPSAIRRGIAAGDLELVQPGVVRLVGVADTFENRIRAAALSLPGSMVSHDSAAEVWGVPLGGVSIHLIVPRGRARTHRNGVILHHPTLRADLVARQKYGVTVTSPLRTLIDLGQTRPDKVMDALDLFMVERLVSLPAVKGAIEQHSRPGRNGVVALRSAVDEWSLGELPPDSVLEPRIASFLRNAGISGFEFHLPIGKFVPDFVNESARVVLEFDGWQWHRRDRDRFESDRRRDASLTAQGWVVIRITWRRFVDEPHRVAQEIRATVSARSGLSRR